MQILIQTRYRCSFDSAVGPITLLSDGDALTGLYLPQQLALLKLCDGWIERHDCFDVAKRYLQQYFARLNDCERPQLKLAGTPFQDRVWNELLSIPFGEVRTYGQIARAIGRPSASRAVGKAIGDNPVSIIVPCHRVIGGSGKLTGYAGGLAIKRWLLDHEACLSPTTHSPSALASSTVDRC